MTYIRKTETVGFYFGINDVKDFIIDATEPEKEVLRSLLEVNKQQFKLDFADRMNLIEIIRDGDDYKNLEGVLDKIINYLKNIK